MQVAVAGDFVQVEPAVEPHPRQIGERDPDFPHFAARVLEHHAFRRNWSLKHWAKLGFTRSSAGFALGRGRT